MAEPDQVAGELERRYEDVIDRISFYTPYESEPALWLPIFEELKA